MSQRKTEHPLRTIVLEYDDAKTETEYEKSLIKAYVLLHDKAAELKFKRSKLAYEYQLLHDQITDAEKIFAPVIETVNAFLREAEALMATNPDENSIVELNERLGEYNTGIIHVFHREHLDTVAANSDRQYAELEAYEEAVENFWQQFEAYEEECAELFDNYETYALDIAYLDDDQEDFRATAALLDFDKEYDTHIAAYNRFMDTVTDTYAIITKTQQLFTGYFDDAGLLDSSLSESVGRGETPKAQSPIYLIPPGDKHVRDFKAGYGLLANSKRHTLTINVPVEVVTAGDTHLLHEIVMALQHYPKMIEKWIFAFEFVFEDALGTELTEDQWKGHNAPMLWFNKMLSLPCSVFFIQDRDARFYMLMADLVLKGNDEIADDGASVKLSIETQQELQNRLFNLCWSFLLYCHNTGFDPQPYIEALMSELDAAFTYKDVEKQYLEDVAKGIVMQVLKRKEGDEGAE